MKHKFQPKLRLNSRVILYILTKLHHWIASKHDMNMANFKQAKILLTFSPFGQSFAWKTVDWKQTQWQILYLDNSVVVKHSIVKLYKHIAPILGNTFQRVQTWDYWQKFTDRRTKLTNGLKYLCVKASILHIMMYVDKGNVSISYNYH